MEYGNFDDFFTVKCLGYIIVLHGCLDILVIYFIEMFGDNLFLRKSQNWTCVMFVRVIVCIVYLMSEYGHQCR